MAQQVLMPHRNNDSEDYATIIRAVGIAKDVYGMKLDNDRQKILDRKAQELEQKKADEEARKAAGIINPGEEMDIYRSGKFVPASEGEPQSVLLGRRQADNAPVFGLPSGVKEAEIAAGVKREENKQQKVEAQKKRLNEIQGDFEKKPTYKEATDKLMVAAEVDTLLDTGNPISQQIAKTKVARIANGVGVLTDKDVERVNGSQDLISKAKRIYERSMTGELLPEDINDLREVVSAFKLHAQNQLKKEAERFAEQKSSYVDMTKGDIYKSLNIDGIISDSQYAGRETAGGGRQPMTEQQAAANAVRSARMQAKALGLSESDPNYRDTVKKLTESLLLESQNKATAGR